MKQEVNCINTRAIIDYVKIHAPHAVPDLILGLDPEIDGSGDPEAFLCDSKNWVSARVTTEMFSRARKILKDEEAALKIAQFAVEKVKLGYAQRILLKAFGSTSMALKHAQRINDKWNRTKTVELVSLKKYSAVVRLHWHQEMSLTKDLCLMNKGTYLNIPTMFGGTPPELLETCCYFEGAPFCEYHFSWPVSNRLFEFLSSLFTSKSVLMETIREMEKDKKTIEEQFVQVSSLNRELNQKIKELIALQETGRAILSILDLNRVLDVIMSLLANICSINRALIMTVNREKNRLEYLHAVGYDESLPEEIKNYTVSLDRVSNLLVRVANTGKAAYIPEVRSSTLRKENIMLKTAAPASIFVVPLITRSKVIGLLAVDGDKKGGVPEQTRFTLEIFAPQIAIAIQNAMLYKRLNDQMEEIKESRVLLKRAEKLSMMGAMAARLAHEIKNPMTAIETFIQMLPKKFDDKRFRTDFYSIARKETQRINNLINEMLDLVKPRPLNITSCDLDDLIYRIIALLSPRAEEKKIKIKYTAMGFNSVLMDFEKITQVILNLLSNAMDFTPPGGEILIRTETDKNDGRAVKIHVQDNGRGIEGGNLEKIFEPYFTTKQNSSGNGGTGLGLFIVYNNVKEHNGKITVESSPGNGTRFIVTLPNQPL